MNLVSVPVHFLGSDVMFLCFPGFTWVWVGALPLVVIQEDISVIYVPVCWFRLHASLEHNCLLKFVPYFLCHTAESQ